MDTAQNRAQFVNVSEAKRARGQKIEERMGDLNISARRFHERTEISRRTLQRAIAGEDSVKNATYEQIEMWLDRLERQAKGFAGLPDVPAEAEEPNLVKFTIKGDFGVEVVVEGPVTDRAELEESAMRLMRELRAERGAPPTDAPESDQ